MSTSITFVTIKNIFTVDQMEMVNSIVHDKSVRDDMFELAPEMNAEYRTFSILRNYDYVLQTVQDELSIAGVEFGNNITFDVNEYKTNHYYFAQGVKSYINKRMAWSVKEITNLDDESEMYFHKGYLSAMEKENSEPNDRHDLYVRLFVEGDRFMEDNIFDNDMVIR